MPGTRKRTGQEERLAEIARQDGGLEALADLGAAVAFGKRLPGRSSWVVCRHVTKDEELVKEYLGTKRNDGTRPWGELMQRDVFPGFVTAQQAASMMGEGVALKESSLKGVFTTLEPSSSLTLESMGIGQ